MIVIPAAYYFDKPTIDDRFGLIVTREQKAAIREIAYSVPSQQVCARFEKPHKPRTTGWRSQNKHFNGHVQQICEETGNDFGQLKVYVKRRAMSRGLPAMMNERGDIVYSLVDGEPLPMSEADMDTVQCGWCIDECHVLAAELGITLKEYDE